MRQVFINRTRSSDDGTFGEFRIDHPTEGEPICVTCELPWKNNHPQTSCIPVGTYIFSNYNSRKHGLVWMANNVPDRDFIEIHVANWPDQLLGCIAPGEEYSENLGGTPGVTNSRNAMKSLRALLPGAISVTITENLLN